MNALRSLSGLALLGLAATLTSPAASAATPTASPAPAPKPAAAPAAAPSVGMFANTPDRNMADANAQSVADDWDVVTGRNVKWVAGLGSQTYAGPVVVGGRVYVGTNNEGKKNPKLTGDRGVVMAFDAATGALSWQATHPKLEAGRVNDWPLQGICSTPYVDGQYVYYVSNRAEVVAADVEGFRDGENDGPFATETDTSEIDADVVWKLDLIKQLDVFPHNLAASNPLVVDDLIYVTTGNGVDEGHINIPSPDAPSFVAVDRRDGKVVWKSSLPGDTILHGTWSNATYGVAKGRPQVIFAGGDGWVYSFEPKTGTLLWKFDANPKDAVYELGGQGTRNEIIATPVFWQDKVYVSVGQDPEHGEGIGHLYAIDATGSGDVTTTGALWHRGGDDFHRSISTAAITPDGTLYAADLSGYVYCLNALTGELYWTYNAYAAIWGSPYVVDGKVYIGDEDGDVAILRASRKYELIREINLGGSVYTTPKAVDGVLYIAARTKLYAIQRGAQSAPPTKDKPSAASSEQM
jgi:outer membrane protein assembly factor BamB